MEAIILIGAQSAGKSTFYHERFRDSHVRINLDMLRTRRRERILLQACLEMKQQFVVDNTNPTPEDRARYLPLAKAAGFRTVGYWFQADLKELLDRNLTRLERQRVPEQAIRATYNKLRPPTPEEGFDQLFHVRAAPGGGFVVEKWEVK